MLRSVVLRLTDCCALGFVDLAVANQVVGAGHLLKDDGF
jgi:hypothetical protein